MRIHRSYVPLEGGWGNDTIIADQAAAEALHHDATFRLDRYIQSWNGQVFGRQGNDLIQRDRPGNYTANPDLGLVVEHPGDVTVVGGSFGQNAGQDTISYQLYAGGIEIDLDVGDGGGYAEQHGLVGFEIFGRDRLWGFQHAIGTEGDDLITGSAEANRLLGLDGEDRVAGEAGADTLDGGDGEDTLYGGAGADSLVGGDGDDDIWGGTEADRILGGDGADWLYAEAGDDRVWGNAGDDHISAGDGNDTVWGGAGHNTIYGGADNDSINLDGEGGLAEGGDGNDSIDGAAGNDVLRGDADDDYLWGGAGNDTLTGGAGEDTIDGAAGTDTVIWTGAAVSVTVDNTGAGSAIQAGVVDALIGIERIVTGSGNDSVTMGSQANRIETGSGDDTVVSGGGNDTVLGMAGDDELYGGSGNDSLSGGDHADRLEGSIGKDTLDGGSGDDLMLGGDGSDVMTGGSGADAFIWGGSVVGLDVITDFVIGEDWIGINDILAAPPAPGGSYVGKVFAFWADNGTATVLSALTESGWKPFVTLAGYADPNEVFDAIADGSLFAAPTLGGGPGDIFG